VRAHWSVHPAQEELSCSARVTPVPEPRSAETTADNAGSPERAQAAGPTVKRGEQLPSVGAIVLAFLASQHHSLMMLLLTFGFSGAAMSFMTVAPLVRRGMLAMSLAMVAVIIYQIRDSRRPQAFRIGGAISILATIGLSAWSISHFGL
jgi:hypothetical protein